MNKKSADLIETYNRGLIDGQKMGKKKLEQLKFGNKEFEADCKRMTGENLQLRLKNKRMREAIEYLLNTSGPMTSQQKECWPALEQTLKDKDVS